MPDYLNGKIYKIVDNTNGNLYIGSTTQSLTQRLAGHVRSYNFSLTHEKEYLTSFEIIKNGDYEIILIENVECENREQLRREERKHIELNICVNKNIPNQSKKEYNIKHKDEINESRKIYYSKNFDQIKERKQEYRKQNIDSVKEYEKDYRDRNQERIKERNSQIIICECGVEVSYKCLARHKQRKQHQTYLAELNPK